MLSPHLGEIPRSLGCRGLAVKIQEVHANLQEIPVSRKVAQIHCITEKWRRIPNSPSVPLCLKLSSAINKHGRMPS